MFNKRKSQSKILFIYLRFSPDVLLDMCVFLYSHIGSTDFLLEGDLLIPRTRNAMRCYSKTFSCLWPKSANGKVEIPFVIDKKYSEFDH